MIRDIRIYMLRKFYIRLHAAHEKALLNVKKVQNNTPWNLEYRSLILTLKWIHKSLTINYKSLSWKPTLNISLVE